MKNKKNKLPKYDDGGVKNFFGNYGKALADTTLGIAGLGNIIPDSAYKGGDAENFANISNIAGTVGKTFLPIAANMVAPGSGQLISAGQQAIGGFNPQDPSQFDEMGNPKNPNMNKINQGIGSLGQVAGMFAMGGKACYPGGGMIPNAEVEKQENTLNPDGSTTQFNGPTHEGGGIQTHLDPNTLIFSDRLKHQGKTFAILNKSNNTSKEDKILDDPDASNTLKQTAQLMKDTKIKNSLSLFQIQEELKANKVNNYAKKLGVNPQEGTHMMPDGSTMNNSEMYAGGGLKRSDDYGSKSKPYPNVNSGDFAGGDRSYPIPTKADAIDALRLAGLHGRSDVRAKVFAKYPELKHAYGGKQPDLYPLGGSIPADQYKQAQMDSLTMYKAGLASKNMPAFQYPGAMEAQGRLSDLQGTAYNPTKGIYHSNEPGYTGAYNVSFPKPTMAPYNPNVNTTVPVTKPTQVVKPFYHPQYGEYVPGIDKSKQRVDVQTFQGGGTFPKTRDAYDVGLPYEQQPYFPQYESSDLELRGNPQIVPNTYEDTMNNIPQTNQNQPNWFNRNKDALYQTGFGLAQNAGQLAYLAEQGKRYDTQQYYDYTPSLLNPNAALSDAEHEARLASLNIRDASGGNAGTYLSNRTALNAQNVINKDRIRQQYANTNAQITNQGKQYNIANKMSVDDINAQNKGKALTNYYSTLGSVGTNVAQGMKDNRAYNLDKEAIGMLPAMFDNPAYKKYIDEYLSSKGYKKSK